MKNSFLLLIMMIVGFASFILLSFSYIPSHYLMLQFLPLFASITFLFAFFYIGHYQSNVASTLVFSITTIRYCIHPVVMAYGHYNSVLKYNIIFNAEYGIYLMMYECAVIYFAIILAIRKFNNEMVAMPSITFTSRTTYIVGGLIAFLCIALLVRPDLTNLFMSIFQIGDNTFTQAGRIDSHQTGSFIRIISTLFTFVFMIVRIVLPVFLIGKIIQKGYSQNFILLSVLFFVFLQFIFITATFAESIISSLILILSIGKFDKNLLNKMLKIAPVFIVGIITFYFMIRHQSNVNSGVYSKYDGGSTFDNLSALMNAYFTGIDNVAATFNLSRAENIQHFFSSMQVTIPFNTTIMGKAGEILPAYFNSANHEIGQIPSTIGDGYYYFGPIFAPLFSFLFSYLAIKYNALALNVNSYWKYITFMLAAVLFSLGIGMYNEVITLQYFWSWVIPVYLVSKYL